MKKTIITSAIIIFISSILYSQSCDTVFNYGINDSKILEVYNGIAGYMGGHNEYGDRSKAESFVNPFSGSQLRRAMILFGISKTQNPTTSVVKVKVWDNSGTDGLGVVGAPGIVLREQDVLISNIPSNGNKLTVTFTPPVIINSNKFYIGVSYTYANGDTASIMLNGDGESIPGTSWEEWENGEWYSFEDSYEFNRSFYIDADVCPITNCPTITINQSGVTANTSCGNANGGFTVSANGGTSPYNYSITGGISNTNGIFSGLTGNTYTVTVTDANGCTSTTSVNVSQQTNNPNVTLNSIPPTSTTSSDGSVTTNVTGGNPPYSYTWNNNATTSNINSLSVGVYAVTVTDANGCSASGSISIEPPLNITQLNDVFSVRIYPNPIVNYKINLVYSSSEYNDVYVKIYTPLGVLIINKNYRSVKIIEDTIALDDYDNLSSGVYYFVIGNTTINKSIPIILNNRR
jgi:hypothetical protein